jgi:hypothetical protein
MDFGRLLKWIVIIAIVVVAWKVVLPWIKGQGTSEMKGPRVVDAGCVGGAQRASEAWGSGLSRFVNPPYDMQAWSSFKSDVDSKISRAESECGCAQESCATAKQALADLRSLVNEFDTAIRNGSAPPEDAVQRQEQIDNRIEQADEQRRAGK